MTIETNNQDLISDDCPIQHRDDDRLGRWDLVEDVVKILESSGSERSFTIGISGPWGSGKTSLLNLIESHPIMKDEEEFCFFHFNPWMYSDYEKLISIFLGELCTIVEPISRKLGKKVTKYAKVFGKVAPLIIGTVNPPLGTMIREYSSSLSSLNTEQTIYELQKEISSHMKKLNKKIIVVIDDIDRLDGKEIATIFKLIRAVANFPNIIYLILYDEAHVCKSLDKLELDGKEFLCKIIQLPISLPEIGNGAIKDLISTEYEKTVGTKIENNLIMHSVLEHTKTFRDAYRLMNIFRYNYSISKNEINPADLLGISCLRIKYKEVFDWIIEEKNQKYQPYSVDQIFREEMIGKPNTSERETLMKKYENDHRLPKKAIGLMRVLFPNFSTGFTFTNSDINNLAERRVCSDLFFWNYFTLIPSLIPNRKESIEHLAKRADSQEICRTIIESGWNDRIQNEILAQIYENRERLELYLRIFMCNNEITTEEFVDRCGKYNPCGEKYFEYYFQLEQENMQNIFDFIAKNIPLNDVDRIIHATSAFYKYIFAYFPQDSYSDKRKEIRERIEKRITSSTMVSVQSKYYFQIPLYISNYEDTQKFLNTIVKNDDDLYYLFDRIEDFQLDGEYNPLSRHWVYALPYDRIKNIAPRDGKQDEKTIGTAIQSHKKD